MGKIRVNTDAIDYQMQQMEHISSSLDQISSEISEISRGLSWQISSREQIKNRLDAYVDYVARLTYRVNRLHAGLNSAKLKYISAEQRANPDFHGISVKSPSPISDNKFRIEKAQLLVLHPMDVDKHIGKYWKMLAVLPIMPMMPVWGPLIFNTMKNTSWKLLDGKLDWNGKATWDIQEGEAGATVEGSASGSLLTGTIDGKAGIASGTATVNAGNGAVKGEAGATLFKDGKLSPQIKAKASAEASVAKGEAKGQLGNDDYNLHAGADGALLKAKAEAGAAAGKITYQDETGNTKTGYGVEASAGAEAYVAEGKVSGGFTFAGVKVDLSASGKAGGAGAKAGGRITTGGMSGEIGAGLGLGASIKIDIDWSGLFKKKK